MMATTGTNHMATTGAHRMATTGRFLARIGENILVDFK